MDSLNHDNQADVIEAKNWGSTGIFPFAPDFNNIDVTRDVRTFV